MLAYLEAVEFLAHPQSDVRPTPQWAAGAAGGGNDLLELPLGGLQEFLALARALLGQERVAAHHEPLARILRIVDLGQVTLVEERELQRTALDELADCWLAQCGDPLEPLDGAQLLGDALLRQHPPVADPHHVLEAKALAHLAQLAAQRLGVAGIAREHLHRHRAALGTAQQPQDDLRLALLAIARVAKRDERATLPLEVDRGDVVEHERPLAQVALGQRRLDPRLTRQQPVHGFVEFVRLARAQAEQLAERGAGGVGIEAPGGGELGARLDQARHEHRQHQIALTAAPACEQALHAQAPQRAEHRGDVAVGAGAHDLEHLVRGQQGFAAQHAAQLLDRGIGQMREVGEGALSHPAAVAVGLAQQDGGRRVAVGHALDVHGHIISTNLQRNQQKTTILHGYQSTPTASPIPPLRRALISTQPVELPGNFGLEARRTPVCRETCLVTDGHRSSPATRVRRPAEGVAIPRKKRTISVDGW